MARRSEEHEFAEGGPGPTRWERLMRGKMYAALALVAATGIAAFFVPYPAALVVFGLFGLASATALTTGIAALAASRSRLDDAEHRRLKFWRGKIGRWLFKVAGFRLRGAVPLAAAADRPTEMAIGMAAIELFEALPKETRRQLGDLPGVVRALEQDAARLRSAANAAPAREAALGALENLRLDLLRLGGGLATVESVTQDPAAAREVGEGVDRLLEAFKGTHEAGRGRMA